MQTMTIYHGSSGCRREFTSQLPFNVANNSCCARVEFVYHGPGDDNQDRQLLLLSLGHECLYDIEKFQQYIRIEYDDCPSVTQRDLGKHGVAQINRG